MIDLRRLAFRSWRERFPEEKLAYRVCVNVVEFFKIVEPWARQNARDIIAREANHTGLPNYEKNSLLHILLEIGYIGQNPLEKSFDHYVSNTFLPEIK